VRLAAVGLEEFGQVGGSEISPSAAQCGMPQRPDRVNSEKCVKRHCQISNEAPRRGCWPIQSLENGQFHPLSALQAAHESVRCWYPCPQTRVVQVTHMREMGKPTNTGQLALDCIEGARLLERGHREGAPRPRSLASPAVRSCGSTQHRAPCRLMRGKLHILPTQIA